jgi:hypothetical protein
MTDAADDEVVFDRAYLRSLLTEVRPDTTLDDFKFYANLPEDTLAALLAEILNEGEAAIYPDEFNAPILCLTALGASRAGVKLSQSHPPIWLREDGHEPPILAVQDAGFVLFTDMVADAAAIPYEDTQADPRQLEPVEVLCNVEEFSEWLMLDRRLPDGELIPSRAEFCLLGADRSWPRGHAHGADTAPPDTPSASTWQELFTRCPFCRTLKPGEVCQACHGQAPARRCPDCDGKAMGFIDLCLWCQRSGIDHVLPRAEVAQARRKPNRGAKRAG